VSLVFENIWPMLNHPRTIVVRLDWTAGSASKRVICVWIPAVVARLPLAAAAVSAASGSVPRRVNASWLATSYGVNVVAG